MLRLILALVLISAPFAAAAQSEREIRAQAQASMLVTGTIDIEPDGSVSAYVLDHKEKLPPFVADVVDKAVPGWHFEPVIVDGTSVPARSRMTLRLVAAPATDEGIEVRISSASFGAYDEEDTGSVRAVSRPPPRYPSTALRLYTSGTVYLALKIGREGEVLDVAVEQVNLRSAANGTWSDRLRTLFSEAAIKAAREWVFLPPSTGDQAAAPYWTITTSTAFVMQGEAHDEYGRWIGYIPGPRQTAPWLQKVDRDGGDALADGTIRQHGAGPQLLTKLQPDT